MINSGFTVRTQDVRSLDVEIKLSDPRLQAYADENKANVAALISAWAVLLSDSPFDQSMNTRKYAKLFIAFQQWLLRDITSAVDHLSRLADELVRGPEQSPTGSLKGPWLPKMSKLPIFREYRHWYTSGDERVFKYILTFLHFGKKMEIEDEQLKQTAFRRWQSVEEELSVCTTPGFASHLKEIFLGAGITFQWSTMGPRFGPGAVSERGVRGRQRKCNNLRTTPSLNRALFRWALSCAPSGEGGDTGLHDSRGQISEPGAVLASRGQGHGGFTSPVAGFPGEILGILYDRGEEESSEVSRLMFVKKNYKTARSICMEPNSVMFIQQAVKTVLEDGIRNSVLHDFIDIRDQSKNQRAAKYGSEFKTRDTIDLSDASDRVRVDVVKAIFDGELLEYLLDTRTSKVLLPDGRTVQVHKFAPMGSALCFPVQSIVFALVCVYAAMLFRRGLDGEAELEGDDPYLKNAKAFMRKQFGTGGSVDQFEPLNVYGDDICVDTRLTPIVVRLLTRLGLMVNTQKSYVGNKCYRESCGKQYLDGDDVSSMYWRPKSFGTVLNEKSFASLCSIANNAGQWGYKRLRSYVIHLIRQSRTADGFYGQPLFSDTGLEACSIMSAAPDLNSHLKTRRYTPELSEKFHRLLELGKIDKLPSFIAYQRDEVRSMVVKGSKRRTPIPDSVDGTCEYNSPLEAYLYMQWVSQSYHRTGSLNLNDSGSSDRIDVLGSTLGWRWTPA